MAGLERHHPIDAGAVVDHGSAFVYGSHVETLKLAA